MTDRPHGLSPLAMSALRQPFYHPAYHRAPFRPFSGTTPVCTVGLYRLHTCLGSTTSFAQVEFSRPHQCGRLNVIHCGDCAGHEQAQRPVFIFRLPSARTLCRSGSSRMRFCSIQTEAVIFGTRQRLSTIDGTHGITVAGSPVYISPTP